MTTGDTIAAVATARGAAALAVVRVTGPEAVSIAVKCFESGEPLDRSTGRTVHVGHVVDAGGVRVDHVVATVFRAPASATGEDVVEFSCHGGAVAPRRILDSLLAAGARMARAGEFTERAFVNGKVDLTQAEAIADLIHATSTRAHDTALRQLDGRFSHLLGRLRAELLELCGWIELELDFSDTDQSFADLQRLRGVLKQCKGTLGALLSQSRTGELVRDGVRVVILGRPNAGKSTLLNALVGHDRAIVSETAGTTRDLVEADLELDGFLYRLVDTAGLRYTGDDIESEGVRRAERAGRQADMIVYVYDATVGLAEDEHARIRDLADSGRPVLVVANKGDLADLAGVPGTADGAAMVLSARQAILDGRVLDPLIRALVAAAEPLLRGADSSPVLMNVRHASHLRRTLEAIERAEKGLESGATGDILAMDLRQALRELGAISGEITSEDVLSTVFSRFCIGK